MNVINELENKTTAVEKEIFLMSLQDELLADLWLIYGRVGNAGREEKITIIGHCDKTRGEKLEAVKKFLISVTHARSLFSALGDTQQVAREKRALKRLKAWKGYFENETKN